jgi:hypothetical protein
LLIGGFYQEPGVLAATGLADKNVGDRETADTESLVWLGSVVFALDETVL